MNVRRTRRALNGLALAGLVTILLVWPQPDRTSAASVQMVAAGGDHTCALTGVGGLKCWGRNLFGEVGDGTTAQRTTPVNVSGLTSGVAAVAAGYGTFSSPAGHTCAVTAAGGLKCWGHGVQGQLGDGTSTNQSTPVDVSGLTTGVAAVSTGRWHTCALTTAGGVKCWGRNDGGQLGDGTAIQRTTPVDVTGLTSGVAAVAAGGEHSCALTTAGGLKCWGQNLFGEVGDGTNNNTRTTPVDVSGLTSGAAAVATGFFHTCGLTTAGGLRCWGRNNVGQLGDGTGTNQSLPVNVSGLTSGVAAVSTGPNHTCASTTAGGLKCWGFNGAGQLGDGTTTQRLTPVDVSGLTSGAAAVAAGGGHTCGLTTVGGIKCWGNNDFGQLGDGTTTQRLTPANVSGLGPKLFMVDSVLDVADDDPGNGVCDDGAGNCTLRAAIQETNALAGAQTIILPAGKYVLTLAGTLENAAVTGDLDITDDVTITGAGADVTIVDANALDRVFQILGSGSVVAMTGITVTNGSATGSSGGISNSGTLTLVGSQVSGNTASSSSGGIDNGGFGTLTIDSSTISNNIAGSSGGGIGNLSGGLTIINSTISGNTAGADGGGIFQDDLDGAVELRNVTITNNSAAPGSGGGIAWDASTSANIRNTIIAGNDSAEGPDCFTLSGEKLTSDGYNLIGNNTDCTFNATIGDQIGTAITPIDPLIGTLQDNGGPTLTHALPAVSPAIDAGNPGPPGSGNNSCEATDQRGEARAKDGDSNGQSLCDIGSFEAEGVAAAPGEPFTFDATLDIDLNLIPTSCEATGHLSAAFDPVGDGDTDNLDDVSIEITALSGFIDCPGPIFAGSSIPNVGVIEEQVDVTPGQLDFPANGDFTLCLVADTYPFGVLRNCPDSLEPEAKKPLNISCKIFSLLSFDCQIVGTSTFFNESDTEVAVVQSGDMALQQMAPVGGIAEAPDVEPAPLETDGSSGLGAGAVTGIVAGMAASVLALGGAGWYARRRRRG